MLRFLYGFDYNELQESFGVGKLKEIKSAETHMNIFFAAQKYRIPQLGEKAFQHLRRDVDALRHVGNATLPTIDIFDFVTCLIAHSVHHPDFSTLANDLINARLPSLFKLAEFRSLLETEPWKETLKLCERAIRCGHAFVSSKGNGNVEWLLECEDCDEGWITEEKKLSCPSCGGRTLKARKCDINDFLSGSLEPLVACAYHSASMARFEDIVGAGTRQLSAASEQRRLRERRYG